MRLWVRPRVRISLSAGFSRAVQNAPDASKINALYLRPHPLAGQSVSRVGAQLERKENSSRGPGQRRRLRLRCRTLSTSRCGNINPLPFRRAGRRNARFRTELPYGLGSTNPCPIAVHMEPFSTSVFKVLIWIFATNTKIRTRVGFSPAHAATCATNPTPSYSCGPRTCPHGGV